MQKKSFEVLIKLRAVLILDLPDFIQLFILNLKNKLDAYIKRILNTGAKSNKAVDEFEVNRTGIVGDFLFKLGHLT